MSESGVTVVLDGGLANQLFQRVAGMVVESRSGRPVRFSTRWLGTGRYLGVTPWNLEIPLTVEDMDGRRLPPRLAVSVARRGPAVPRGWLIQGAPDDDALERLDDSTSLAFGYFQRVDHVREVWPQIQTYLAGDPRTRLLQGAPVRDAIAVHMRLGDYLTNPTASRTHGVLDPSYFTRAIGRLVDEGLPPQVSLVSDEPGEALRRLRVGGLPDGVEVVLEASTSPWHDLSVLAAARGVVMSNSSFSWWGAYLAHAQRAARVVYPRRWFAEAGEATPPILLPEWIPGS